MRIMFYSQKPSWNITEKQHKIPIEITNMHPMAACIKRCTCITDLIYITDRAIFATVYSCLSISFPVFGTQFIAK